MSAVSTRRIRLGELLLRAGVITEDQLRTALAEQKKWGGKLGSLLVDMNFLDEDLLVKALSKQLGLPRVDFNGLVIDDNALAKIEPSFAEQHQVIPISLDVGKGMLVVAMSDPDKLDLVDEIAFKTGCRVKVAICGERALAAVIREKYFNDAQELPSSSGLTPESDMKLLSALGENVVEDKGIRNANAGSAPNEDSNLRLEQRLESLEQMQRKEVRVLKALVDLLIEKGHFSKEEYRRQMES